MRPYPSATVASARLAASSFRNQQQRTFRHYSIKIQTSCTNVKEYARESLDTLSIKMLSDFIHDKVLPNLVMDLFDSTEKSARAMMTNNKEEYSN
jgi:hypothetical protein